MNKHYLEKLEYIKILEKLSLYCKTYIGKAFAMKENEVKSTILLSFSYNMTHHFSRNIFAIFPSPLY